ncbi:MAG: 4Fe-4S dicluster domain-containing protein [Candidatus Eisenbacteria bacterium]|nr:4Fe-4S dicluster domain-containing protein [Candidatus Eisenbacteria bacterium]
MPETAVETGVECAIEVADLDPLLGALRERGFTVMGPLLRDGAVIYDEVRSSADLPAGWTDRQEPGSYRLQRSDSPRLFDFTVGPSSWKRFLHPPALRLWQAHREDGGFQVVDVEPPPPRLAFLAVRACEIHAIAVQDRVLLGGPHVDPAYRARRAGLFVVAVQCTRAGATCFCASMKTGPRAGAGYDLALTEVLEAGRHWFRVEVGSERGAEVLAAVPHRAVRPGESAAAERALAGVAEQMGRTMETAGLPALLRRSPEHPRWSEVANRCLACGNCTMVCPTCFCTTVEDTGDLAGRTAERVRRWDSCFSAEFSYIHGGSVRPSIRARYRQWLTHKLSTWHDQFGESGCVGCGRCITWCPAGIDLTEEVRALQASKRRKEDRRADA